MKLEFLSIVSTAVFVSCSSPSLLEGGKVSPANFYHKMQFSLAKSLIMVPVEIDGEVKDYLFDTGATVTTVQRDSMIGKVIRVRGASNRSVENGSEIIESLKIGSIRFTNTFATNEKLTSLADQIPNFGGILGRTIITKANWLIDYPNRTLEISNRDLSDSSFTDIVLLPGEGAPCTHIQIDEKEYRAIIDLGSTSVLNVPKGSPLAAELLQNYDFTEEKRERYTVGGTELISEQVGFLPLLRLGELTFENVRVNINLSSQLRLGMSLFTDNIIYIDNSNQKYRLKAAG